MRKSIGLGWTGVKVERGIDGSWSSRIKDQDQEREPESQKIETRVQENDRRGKVGGS